MAGREVTTGVDLSACPFAYHRLHHSCAVADGTTGAGGEGAREVAEPWHKRLPLALPRAVVFLAGGRSCGPNPRGRDRNSPPPAASSAGTPAGLAAGTPAGPWLRRIPLICLLLLAGPPAALLPPPPAAAGSAAGPSPTVPPPAAAVRAAGRPGLYETFRWLRLAERLAHAEVTHQICGWGFLDLRTPLAGAVFAAEGISTAYPEILQRFDTTLQERQRQEAQLAAAAPPPPQRLTGLHATAGCPESLRQHIQALPESLNRFLENLW